MFKHVNPLLNAYAQKSHVHFERTCVWTILTIMEQFNGQKRRMQDVDENGAESKYLWGWKRKSYEYIQAHGKRIYDELMDVDSSDLGVRKKNIIMMGILTEIPGLMVQNRSTCGVGSASLTTTYRLTVSASTMS